ncbi:MAG TPA: hypothetical protein P5550_10390, partial [Bacteroidales bacterium]|nr:hypothetical protein [Bacteroidales bacterium]
TLRYPGYHELAYLHPSHFTPDPGMVNRLVGTGPPYLLIRLSALSAHHDKGVRGITLALVQEIIALAGERYRVFISAERPLPEELSAYRLTVDPTQVHHLMAGARVYLGDSQTMAAESAMLGVPYIRYNDFVGRITYLAQLENDWQLGFGFRPGEEKALLECLRELLQEERGDRYMRTRDRLLTEKIDTSAFLTWFLHRYPSSSRDMTAPGFDWGRYRP